ncbi:hypothetical protein [Streptomyces hirsutus]|uniref:hypothetical protein n=1 Tax=Streptomyces hirsutus TaxID=35620 RepID=UPI00369C6526
MTPEAPVPDIPASVLSVSLIYSGITAAFGDRPNAPLLIRWPHLVWVWLAHSWRRPTAPPRRPDYARIDQLERELGLTEERPIRPHRTVCLTKDCGGDTEEIRTWSGQLVYRIHHCEPSTAEGAQR